MQEVKNKFTGEILGEILNAKPMLWLFLFNEPKKRELILQNDPMPYSIEIGFSLP